MTGSSVKMFSKANEAPANNIAAKESWGHKKRENVFVNSFISTKTGGVSYVNSKTRSTIDQQGTIVNTGVASDIAMDGEGMIAVSSSADGEVKYTRRGDFRQDELGYWKNGSGQLLKAWKLDADGKLPQNSSLLSSLEAVNFANTKGLPVQTTVVSIAMNLNADQESLRGPGPENGFLMQRAGNNKATKATDILLPDQVGAKGLRVGDAFTFTSSAGKEARTVNYGGITIGNKLSSAEQVFGASSANVSFDFGVAAAPGVIVDGQQLRIAVDGGSSYTFTAMSGQPNGTNFNSVQTLANAINKISSLNARVVDERLYIAPKDASKGLTYTNVGGGTNIVETLGLKDIQAAAIGENRFNSLHTLRDVVNANKEEGSLLATIEGNDIKITSLLSNSTFNVQSNQVSGHQIAAATINPEDNAVGGATVSIEAKNSNLKAGDLVRITDMGDPNIPNGVYSVGTVGSNSFTINIVGAAATYNQPKTALAPAAATWQIASGARSGASIAGAITANNAGANSVTITAAADPARIVGDVMYISGGTFRQAGENITLPTGYYPITAVGGGNTTFDVDVTDVTTAAVDPAFTGDSLNFRKVGEAGDVPFNTTIFTTGAAGSTLVEYNAGGSHSYSVGSIIRFADVGAPFDGITLTNNVDYKVTSVANGVITFDVAGAVDADGAPVAGGVVGAGGQAIDLATQSTVKLNDHSRLFDYFGLDSEKTLFKERYNPLNVDQNLTGGNFSSSETFTHPLTMYDSLGSPYTVLLHFAKLEDNKWAVELAAQQDANGVYDIEGLKTKNGLIQSGVIEFNTDGTLNPDKIIGFDERVNIKRAGRAESAVMIDFPNKLSDITSGTVSQVKSNGNNVEIVQSDGQAPGTLLKLEVNPEGFIVGTFDSGETRKLYQIPVAIFANVNGLVAGANGTFEISRESGDLLLKQAGAGGAGRTLGGVLEASNVDVTEELLSVQELGNTVRANARVTAAQFKNMTTVLSELNN